MRIIRQNPKYRLCGNNDKFMNIGIHVVCLKSLGPIDRKFHGHGENDGFVLYEYMYIIKQFGRVSKYTNTDVMKKKVK